MNRQQQFHSLLVSEQDLAMYQMYFGIGTGEPYGVEEISESLDINEDRVEYAISETARHLMAFYVLNEPGRPRAFEEDEEEEVVVDTPEA